MTATLAEYMLQSGWEFGQYMLDDETYQCRREIIYSEFPQHEDPTFVTYMYLKWMDIAFMSVTEFRGKIDGYNQFPIMGDLEGLLSEVMI